MTNEDMLQLTSENGVYFASAVVLSDAIHIVVCGGCFDECPARVWSGMVC